MDGYYEMRIAEKYIISQPDVDGTEMNPDFNNMLYKYATNILLRGWKTWSYDGNIYGGIKSLTVDEFLLLLAFGGDVKYVDFYIKVAEADINNLVPEGLPNRLDVDGIPHSWATWRVPNYPLGDAVDGYYKFPSYSFGKYLTAEQLMIIHNSADAELIERPLGTDQDLK